MGIRSFFLHTKIGQGILTIFIILITAIIEELFSLNAYLSKPLIVIGNWNPEGTLMEKLKFFILLLVYLAPIVLLIFAIFDKNGKKNRGYQSNSDYGKLIAELSMAVNDRAISNDLTEEKVNKLFNALIDDVCGLYYIKRSDVRVSIIYRERSRQKLTSWRYGRAITDKQQELDLLATAILLETEKTYPTWENVKDQFENGDTETIFFIRNTGNDLKLGVLISVATKVETQRHLDDWGKIVYPFTMLGHMDKLVRFVVNYK